MQRANAKEEKPIQAVFISDLHLHPDDPLITKRYEHFLKWVVTQTSTLYILGDFFHVWAGDDAKNAWSTEIAQGLAHLQEQGVTCYFMPGNRDFLLGPDFAKQAGWRVLSDPTLIELGGEPVLLSHGDRYCSADKAHQWFRCLTRGRGFRRLWSWLPLSLRLRCVQRVRAYSATHNCYKSRQQMDVVEADVVASLNHMHARILIHGHTHQPKVVQHRAREAVYTRYVLSDWDDTPHFLCYYKTHGFKIETL